MYLLSFIRWEVGTDWEPYYIIFKHIGTSNSSFYEWGFIKLNQFASMILDDYTLLLFITATIIFTLQTNSIKKYSFYPITSLLVAWSICFGNIFFVRQTIALAITFFSIRYIKDNNFLKFSLLILIASLFHRSAIIFFLSWWVFKMRISIFYMYIVIIISFLSGAYFPYIIDIISNFVGGDFQYKIQHYLDNKDNMFGVSSSISSIIMRGIPNKLGLFFIFTMFLKKEMNLKYYRGLINLYWLGIILYCITIQISLALARVVVYFDILQIILIPLVFYSTKGVNKKVLFLMIITYLVLKLYISLTGYYYDLYIPYKTFWNYKDLTMLKIKYL